MRTYSSDINKEQFEVIRDDLENFKKTTRPRKLDLYDIFCGVLYILTTGAQWRNLPSDYPNWKTVYYYYDQWRTPNEEGISLLETVHKKIGRKYENVSRA